MSTTITPLTLENADEAARPLLTTALLSGAEIDSPTLEHLPRG